MKVSKCLVFLALGLACSRSQSARPMPDAGTTSLKVAAAADLALAFKEVGDAFERTAGHRTVFTFGSTGLLTKQVLEGAPYDVLAAANVSFVDDLVGKGGAFADSKALYATGRLALYTPEGIEPAKALKDLTNPRFRRIAIANPEHAPYGRAARQAFERVGILEQIKGRLVFGENIQQTLQFADTGNTEAAVISLSLAGRSRGHFSLIDPSLHDRIDQALVVCTRSTQPELARRFTAFVVSAEGRAILGRYGFVAPGAPVTSRP